MMGLSNELTAVLRQFGESLRPPAGNQVLVRRRAARPVSLAPDLPEVAAALHVEGYYLATLVGVDERSLVDNCFKLYYVFGHPEDDLFVIVEDPLPLPNHLAVDPTDLPYYGTIRADFPAVAPFEQELAGLLGVVPRPSGADPIMLDCPGLHREYYPDALYPLRRDRLLADILGRITELGVMQQHALIRRVAETLVPADGEWVVPVGPVHAGVIPSGQFLFRVSGEAIEELRIRLGYTHKGIERLFQSEYTLPDGWRLAEHVTGDSCFAHSLAYCQAAEELARCRPPAAAEQWRVLFLELERMANHIGDCAALAHDVAADIAASELAALREELLQLCGRLGGHRLLRGVNRPGGVVLPAEPDLDDADHIVAVVAAQFAALAEGLAGAHSFRIRLQWAGILTRRQALACGAAGVVARASGVPRDARRQHPMGGYRETDVQALLDQAAGEMPTPRRRESTAGDCLARFLMRVREVECSAALVRHIVHRRRADRARVFTSLSPVDFVVDHNFEFGLSVVEGWRGAVIYWLMQDKFGRIFRCKVRDPSLLNWPALQQAVQPHTLDEDYLLDHAPPEKYAETMLGDFPIINQSFNLSYSGTDL